ncbi:MAG: hypothetical protein KF832_04860 [Caldilineaceae bacterium]|nr:hypothetical protein [Caldilineaceae bacterium]
MNLRTALINGYDPYQLTPTIGVFAVLLAALLFFSYTPVVNAEGQSPTMPLTPHCVGSGPLPLDPDFCGCTWGAVYYRGKPVLNAPVVLEFGNQSTSAASKVYADVQPEPYYTMTGAGLGAKKGDFLTVQVAFAGQTAARTFRAWPDENQEQEVALVLPERGRWESWLTSGYTTLSLADHTLWAGGTAGLRAIDLTTQSPVTHTLPWSDPTVLSMAVAPNGHVWAAGAHTLAEFDGSNWQNRTPPFGATIRALAIHPTTGALWLGGGDNQGALAMYDGAWHMVTAVTEEVRALAVDGAGDLWVGTWGGGVYRHDDQAANLNSDWRQYKINAGLASDYILTTATDARSVWFGTRPYADGQGKRGGISRYRWADNSWTTYTAAHGLPTDILGAAAPINALAVAESGLAWAGTPTGLYLLAAPETWVSEMATGTAIRAVAVHDTQVIAARTNAPLLRLDQSITPGNPPTVQLAPTNPATVTQAETITLTASATDQDNDPNESGEQILAWDWRINDEPFCTTANQCAMPANLLTLGNHTLSLRVQDDEGVWSQPVTTTLRVTPAAAVVYLPQISTTSAAQAR